MQRLASLIVLTTAYAGTATANGGPTAPVGYAQATGYYKQDARPTLYQPLHLLDSREATAWCSPSSDPLEERLTFGFKGTAEVDEVRVYTGNGLNAETFKEFSRARKFHLQGPDGGMNFAIADERGLQTVMLNPPLVASELTLQVLDQYPAEDPEMPVCITDIVFYSGGKPLNGAWLTQKLKFDRTRSTVLGTWFAGSPGAPDKYLSFYVDGTFRFVHQPFDPNVKPSVIEGEYDVSGAQVSLNVSGAGKGAARASRAGTEKSVTRSLVVEGELPPLMKAEWRDKF